MPNPLNTRDSDLFSCEATAYHRPITYYDNASDFIDAIADTGLYPNPVGTFSHERAHLACARAVGLAEASYNIEEIGHLRQAGVITGRFTCVPRLALAAVAVAPIDPSGVDFQIVRSYDYETVDQIIEKVRAWNDRFEHQIPLPGALDPRSQG